MKNIQFIKFNTILLLGCMLTLALGCERDLSDDAVLATFPNNPNVYTDNPIGLTDEFFISFDPADGANVNGFGVDNQEAYAGTSSIRIDVPAPNDPDGGFIGGIFKDRGAGRNLTQYDALTFWAKGSTTGDLGEAGFGTDFEGDKFRAVATNLQLSTDWKKYIIPIPDASKLVQESGLFVFAAGTESTNGFGFTIWIDELKFEKLGTVAQPRPAILNGQDASVQSFLGGTINLTGLTQTFNTADGDVTTTATPSYFEFSSSDESVAVVNENGVVSVINSGTTIITATLNGVDAQGSLTIESLGDFIFAPTPTRSPDTVISIFSNTYANRPVDFFNGYYAPFQTTLSNDFTINGDDILFYTNFNFVGIEFNQGVPTINATDATHLHFDIFVPNSLPSNPGLRFDLVDFGADASFGGDDDTTITKGFTSSVLTSGEWIPIDINITGLNPKSNLGQIIIADFAGRNTPAEFYVDNIYFYTE